MQCARVPLAAMQAGYLRPGFKLSGEASRPKSPPPTRKLADERAVFEHAYLPARRHGECRDKVHEKE
jgi:hypothetical protein